MFFNKFTSDPILIAVVCNSRTEKKQKLNAELLRAEFMRDGRTDTAVIEEVAFLLFMTGQWQS